ncbi:sigma factor G inhibitor Gin [Halobacillus massiliensis]|uniref:sigma factor G inhibitor Gin n=1 Tax=Halobacillus massiliensis TaxID=1926286 RepID=UPI0009E40231|nr:sigma factor G inhibitor Gin [Halobacillus massiliensis]
MKTPECCSICSKKTDNGILLLKVYICDSCEKEMLNTPADDPKYQYFIDQMNKAYRTAIHS